MEKTPETKGAVYKEVPRQQPYRSEKSFEERQREAQVMLDQHKGSVPIIVEKAATEKFLPFINRNKYLVPGSTTLGRMHDTIRVRLQLHKDQSFFLLVEGRHMPSLSSTIEEVYGEYKAEDGFLYLQYVSQEVFG